MDINSLQQINQILSSTKLITSDAQLASYATLLNQIKADTINDNLTAPSNSKSLSQTGILSLLQGYINSQQLNNTLLNLLATSTTRGLTYLNNPITISNNVGNSNTHVDFSAGNAPLDDGSSQVLLSSVLTKRLDASWVAGTGNGGLFNGIAAPKANSTKYYLFVITNGTITDAGFDSSPIGANIPAGYKGSYRGTVLTDGNGNIRAFTLAGQYMEYVNEVLDNAPTPTSGVYQTYTLSCPNKPNIVAYIRMNMVYTGSGVVPLDFFHRKTGSTSANYFGGGAVSGYTAHNPTNWVCLNSSAQIDLAFGFVAPTSNFAVTTKGYFDYNIKI